MEEDFFKVGYTTYVNKQPIAKKKWTSRLLGKIAEHKFLTTIFLIILVCILILVLILVLKINWKIWTFLIKFVYNKKIKKNWWGIWSRNCNKRICKNKKEQLNDKSKKKLKDKYNMEDMEDDW